MVGGRDRGHGLWLPGEVPSRPKTADPLSPEISISSAQITGAADVVDETNTPVGSWVSRSGGGFTIVGTANDSATGNAKLSAAGGDTHSNGNASDISNFVGKPGSAVGHALLLGESGESHARLAVETSGALRWGDGESDFHSTLRSMRSNATELDLPPIKAGGVASVSVGLEGASTTDVVTASLSSLGDAMVFVSARVAADGRALVLFRNEGEEAVDAAKGTLRVAAAAFG